jgi:glycosyltransferase involved in cell wall biosynthesis
MVIRCLSVGHDRLRGVKVLHVIARVNLGGTARWLETLTAEQLAAGDEVLVATGRVQGDEVEDPNAVLMPLVRLDRLGRAVSVLDDAWAVRELRDLIADLQPDVVNTHTAKAGLVGRAAALSLGRSRPTLVHTVHGHLLTGYFSAAAVRGISASERLMASASDLVLAAGKKVRDDLVAAGIVPADKAMVMRPGVRDFALSPVAVARESLGVDAGFLGEGTVAGWLARVVRVKRPDRLVGAALRTPAVRYLVGGDGALRAGLEERAPANMTSVGWADPATFWSACDLAVLTSDNEAMPYSLVEAALAGLAAVTTNAGSASEVVVDGVTGLVVEKAAGAVAEGVAALAADAAMRSAMGAAARARALVEFSPQRMYAEHVAAYEQAMARHTR